MSETNKPPGNFLNFILLTACGFSLGWMIGMTTQEIVVSVITALLTTAITLVSYFSGLKDDKENNGIMRKVDPKPLALLTIGIGLGAALGIFTRTHNWLGNNEKTIGALALTADEIAAIRASYGGHVNDTIIVQRLFDLDFPTAGLPQISEATERQSAGILFSGKTQSCTALCNALDLEELLLRLEQLETKLYDQVAPFLDSPAQLKTYEDQLSTKCNCTIELH